MVHSFNQPLEVFELHARVLAKSSRGSTLLDDASLLIVNSNDALLRYGTTNIKWLYISGTSRQYPCSCSHASTWVTCEASCLEERIWSQAILACSARMSPHGISIASNLQYRDKALRGLLGERVRNFTVRRALMADRFPAPKKHIRLAMDMLVFLPPASRLDDNYVHVG